MICVQQNLPFLSSFLVRKVEAELSPVKFVRPQDPAGAGRQVQRMSAVLVSDFARNLQRGVDCANFSIFSSDQTQLREREQKHQPQFCAPLAQIVNSGSLDQSKKSFLLEIVVLASPGDENYTSLSNGCFCHQ